jgi:divalent metal cation (Fe/Co/Zn/Cd) transporter
VGLSALLGKPLADAAFGLWVLVFVVWIGIEGWRRAQRGDEV